jgi:hypothetical protein
VAELADAERTVSARVADSTTIPGLLDATFDAFEVIRQVARACESRVPELFAAFMVAATTAVESRNALNDAPSLPPARGGPVPSPTVSPTADVGHVADRLAALAALLARRLTEAAARADLAGDEDACECAAQSAADLHQILGRGNDETVTR